MFSLHAMLEAMKIDKKAKREEPRFVLIDRIGHAVPFEGEICRTVPASLLEAVIQEDL